ncbi:hypothetical protein [Microbacterium sp. S16(2024)]|jgi:hypothetical protein|uniref:hypothetical protein n=1 Tax=Microbacterium sp. S16(2024) TaxID=3368601 RepID=UPI0026AACA8C
MSTPPTGRTYGDREQTPVPHPANRCPTTATEDRPHAPHSTLTHACKVEVGHEGDHRCVCGKTWPPLVGARGATA